MKRRHVKSWQRAERPAAAAPVQPVQATRDRFMSDRGHQWAIFPAQQPVVKRLSQVSVLIAKLRYPCLGYDVMAAFRRIAASVHAAVRFASEWFAVSPWDDYGDGEDVMPYAVKPAFDLRKPGAVLSAKAERQGVTAVGIPA